MGSDREVEIIYMVQKDTKKVNMCVRERRRIDNVPPIYTETNGDKDQRGVYGRIPGGFRGAGRL